MTIGTQGKDQENRKAHDFGDTKNMILNLLLDGSKTAGEIADNLQIQKSAIRIHLESLHAEHAVRSHFKIERLGRPRRVYEITERGRELFPRKYDLILSLLLQKIEETGGHESVKKIIRSIADNMAHNIRQRIKKDNNRIHSSFEESLNILNLVSNEMGFMSSLYKEDDNSYSLVSRNCILHKVALGHQDAICHDLHDRMIQKALDGKINPDVQLKECIALGDNHSRHIISNTTNTSTIKI
ncbi:MAG: ArsR family transcriptional regulator [Nitrososphaeraceae archaeon]|nr:ArsR family transcriptional regulator [Nitrososphaeraceae archaeon]